MKYANVAKREARVGDHIPYTRHVDETTIKTREGMFLSVAKLDGFCFQTADQSQVNLRYNGRNTFLRALNDSRFAVYSHIIRRAITADIGGSFDNPFCAALEKSYMEGIHKRRMFVNDLYFTVVRRGMQGKAGLAEGLSKLLRRAGGASDEKFEREARRELREVMANFESDFGAYGARVLGCAEREVGSERYVYSEVIEFLSQLINGGIYQQRLVPRMGLDEYLPTSRALFNKNAFKIAGPTKATTRFGAMLSIKEYPAHSGPGMLDWLLSVPGEFVVSQSFSVEDRAPVLSEVARVERQIAASDEAGTEVEESIAIARDELVSGRVVLGRHHLTVACMGESLDAMEHCVQAVTKELQNVGVTVAREDLNAEPSFWAQLPGNFAYIARRARISSKNFMGFTSLHNFAVGKKDGNRWGPAISLLQTTSLTPYYFNFHRREVGSFTWTGPTGSGKTLALAFMCAQMMRVMPRPRLAFFDKDQGGEIFIRALGGRYEVLKPGVPSGFNPLQLNGSPEDRKFLSDLLAFLVRPTNGGQLSADQKKIIDSAVEQIFDIPIEARRFADVAQLLSGREVMSHDDMASRFDVWLKGSRAWLFNNERDAWDGSNGILGFDMTKVLDDPEIRTAALGYIFHRIESLMTGDPLALVIDEGWKIAQDPVAAGFVIDKLKTIRKLNGIVGFVTQSAKDIVRSGMAHTLLEQTPTNVFFPNPKADDESYIDGFKLSKRELHWVRSTLPEARQFLIKHDQDSVIAKLDLSHMRPFIKVLSGNVETVAECEALRKQYGDEPEKWLPHFCGLEVGHARDD